METALSLITALAAISFMTWIAGCAQEAHARTSFENIARNWKQKE